HAELRCAHGRESPPATMAHGGSATARRRRHAASGPDLGRQQTALGREEALDSGAEAPAVRTGQAREPGLEIAVAANQIFVEIPVRTREPAASIRQPSKERMRIRPAHPDLLGQWK